MQPSGDRPVVISFRLEHLLGWTITIGLCLVPVILWLQIHPLSTITGFPGIMLSIGRLTGLVGMVMYSLNLIYATRWRFLEYWFGGLNRVYIAHHLLGGLALIFLSFHPLFLALRYVKTSLSQAALMLIPNGLFPISALFSPDSNLHHVVLEQWAIFLGIMSFVGMTVLLLVTFFVQIPYRVWLITHKLLGPVFFLAGLHVLFITSDTTSHAALRYYMLAVCGLGIAAFTYRTLISNIVVRRYRYIVENVAAVGGNVTMVVMKPKQKGISYDPGQFVFVRFLHAQQDHISAEWHPFSISSAPSDGYLKLSIKALGDYTNNLSTLQPGTEAEIEGAYGRFSYTKNRNKKQIWVGAGIGITPFISMAKSLPAESGYAIDLYYAVRNRSEIIDWPSLDDAANQPDVGLRIFPYIGDEQQGYLSADYIEQVSGSLADKDVYICGPPPMMRSLRSQLRAKGIPATSIHTEEFGMA